MGLARFDNFFRCIVRYRSGILNVDDGAQETVYRYILNEHEACVAVAEEEERIYKWTGVGLLLCNR